ncbi:MAG: hypothetical protein U9P80_04140, partial [Thermodesulfobacteriota bacterium]|nr:hypothetical protein [Thermodesulfobacteriota bacterium]
GFDDTINYHLGIEYRLSDIFSVMAGYAMIPTPIPNQSGRVSNYLDSDRDLYSFGMSYTLKDSLLSKVIKPPVKIAWVVQYQTLDKYRVDNTGVKGISWKDQESYTVEGNCLAGGVSFSMAW